VNPDVVAAVARLRAEHVLSARQAAFFDRVAGRRLVSIRLEMRALLYAGILLLTSAVGLLVAGHHQEIGPLAIASAIALAVTACLLWVIRHSPPFAWAEVASSSLAFDYVLLLGLLLFASELGYVEAHFGLLGPGWAHHLLIVGGVSLLAAYRWDSRIVLGLAITTLAAWLGVSSNLVSLIAHGGGRLRANALALGVLYVAAAALSVWLDRKPHFEEVYATAGLFLILGALVSGVLGDGRSWGIWLGALLAAAGAVMWVAFRLGRSLYFAQGVVAAYVGLLRLVFAPFRHEASSLPLVLAALLGIGALAVIFSTHRRMIER
jgi:hypothetical protein